MSETETRAKRQADIELERMRRRVAALEAAHAERRAFEEELRDSEQRFRALVESTADWIWEVDEQGVYTYASPRVKDLLGYEPEEVLGKTAFDLAAPEERARLDSLVRGLIESRLAFVRFERVSLHKDGRRVVVETSGAPVLDPEGRLLGYRGIDRDITERKRSEEALRESERRYRQLLAAVTSYCYRVRIENGVPAATEHGWGCLATTGYSPADYAANPHLWLDMVHRDDRAAVARHVFDVLAGRQVAPIEHRIHHRDGSVRWVRDTIIPHYEAGRMAFYDGLVEDITARKRAEEELDYLFNVSLQMLCIAGTDGYFKRINPAFETTLGYSRQELLARPFVDFVHPDDRELTLAEIRRLSAGEPTIRFDNRYVCKDGSVRWLTWTAMPRPEEGLIYATALDVTQRTRAEEFFRGLLESAPDPMIVVSDRGDIVLVNALTEQLFGYTREELLGQPIEIIVPERFRQRHREYRARFAAQPRARPMGSGQELAAVRKDGSEFPAEISLGPVDTDTGKVTFCAIRDISERKRTEQALRDNRARLLAAQRIQERLWPERPPELPGFDVAGASFPAEFTAGDYFDYLPISSGRTGFVVGDVAGHGFAPALLMASTQALLHSLVEVHGEVDDILTRANAALARRIEEDRFVTLLLVSLDAERRTFTYANAGHPDGYVLGAGGRVKARLESGAMPLGIFPDIAVPAEGPVALEAGDIVLMLTDGVPDARSAAGEPFGIQRALRIAHENRHRTSSEIIRALHAAVSEFSEGGVPYDDVTVIVIKVGPAG